MIRDQRLIDILVADLHFHGFLTVYTGDSIFDENNKYIEKVSNAINAIGLAGKIDPYTDVYHGGLVSTTSKIKHINEYIDDVFIDYFFRVHKFEEIIFPKGFCKGQITSDGIIKPSGEVSIDLNNVYDRCTFAYNIWRLFGVDDTLKDYFNGNNFFLGFSPDKRVYGVHSYCGVLMSRIPYDWYYDEFFLRKYGGKGGFSPVFRGKEVYRFIEFIRSESENEILRFSSPFLMRLMDFEKGYRDLADSHLFGAYTIEDLLFIYSLLTDKFVLNENSFLLALCSCTNKHKIRVLDEFIEFENKYTDYNEIKPFIESCDLCLRFASHTKSKAFTFNLLNESIDEVYLFGKKSVTLIRHSNTMPLPYLYAKLLIS